MHTAERHSYADLISNVDSARLMKKFIRPPSYHLLGSGLSTAPVTIQSACTQAVQRLNCSCLSVDVPLKYSWCSLEEGLSLCCTCEVLGTRGLRYTGPIAIIMQCHMSYDIASPQRVALMMSLQKGKDLRVSEMRQSEIKVFFPAPCSVP